MRARGLIVAAVAALLSISLCSYHSRASVTGSEPIALFNPDPSNVANRLYRELHVRSYHGEQIGADSVDPLLWFETKHLLTDASHKRAMALLEEFIRTHAERQIQDPVRRAILQRDLWAVFDWADTPDAPHAAERRELAAKLAPAIARLSLTREEIATLPDTYALAIQNKELPADFDPAAPNRAFLPPDLLDPRGRWVCLGAPGEETIAPLHDSSFTARSAFLVFARLPGGREATLAYLQRLAEMKIPLFVKMQPQGFSEPMEVFNPEVPQFPVGTEFVLLRKMLLPDRDGQLRATRVTESTQIRHYTDIPNVDPGRYRDVGLAATFQAPSEIELSRASLFSGHSGLRGVTSKDPPLLIFPAMTVGFDALEDAHMRNIQSVSPFVVCTSCHLGPGIQSMMSFSARGGIPSEETILSPRLAETTSAAEIAKVMEWAQKQDRWNHFVHLLATQKPN